MKSYHGWPNAAAKPLKRVFGVLNGSTPKADVAEYWDGDIAWATPDDLGDLDGPVLNSTRRSITAAGYGSCGTTVAPAGSLILSTRAPIGHLAIAALPMCTNQGCRALVQSSQVHPKFFYYQLLAAKPVLQSLGNGSTFKELSKQSLEQFPVWQPSLSRQEGIADFLDRETAKVDALIERKRRLHELLDDSVDSLLSALIENASHPLTTLSLRRVVSRFVDYRGQTPTKTPRGVRLVTARNIKKGRIDYTESEEFISESDYNDWMVRGLPAVGDLLITTEAPLGEVALVEDPSIALAQRIILLKPNTLRVSADYLWCYFRSAVGRAELEKRATGSTAIGIKASHLRSVPVVVPSAEDQRQIVNAYREREREARLIRRSLRSATDLLREQRSALIAAAVTGQIDVRSHAS